MLRATIHTSISSTVTRLAPFPGNSSQLIHLLTNSTLPASQCLTARIFDALRKIMAFALPGNAFFVHNEAVFVSVLHFSHSEGAHAHGSRNVE